MNTYARIKRVGESQISLVGCVYTTFGEVGESIRRFIPSTEVGGFLAEGFVISVASIYGFTLALGYNVHEFRRVGKSLNSMIQRLEDSGKQHERIMKGFDDSRKEHERMIQALNAINQSLAGLAGSSGRSRSPEEMKRIWSTRMIALGGKLGGANISAKA